MTDYQSCLVHMDAYRKHWGLWTPNQQRKLGGAKVAVGGVGGVGAIEALLLAKSGVREIRVADKDIYERDNLVEQAFATLDSLGERKVDVAAREMQRHQAGLRVDTIHGDLTCPVHSTQLAAGVDVLFSGVDNPAARVALGRAAMVEGIPFVVAANVGWSVFHTIYLPAGGGYAAAFEVMPGVQRDGLGFPVMADPVTAAAVTEAWSIWTVAFSGFRRDTLRRYIRGDISSFPYMAGAAFLAGTLAVTDWIRHVVGVGAKYVFPEAQVIDLRCGHQLSAAEVFDRHDRIASSWHEDEDALLAQITERMR